ncbi:1-deoxy-D-xylulose-5-phosphate synthase [Striga asiatica]|uniref:1-deoxy-D-xylulose-5-phosphate synthase n=1 Tax=Striga asiatica TaxID=4170 RepID=A0A5A7R117_STRAF|nr:1-deoxy-D-xylulose-5-phosphate synthase [Striga asiatica]
MAPARIVVLGDRVRFKKSDSAVILVPLFFNLKSQFLIPSSSSISHPIVILNSPSRRHPQFRLSEARSSSLSSNQGSCPSIGMEQMNEVDMEENPDVMSEEELAIIDEDKEQTYPEGEGGDKPFEKKKRGKTSTVWDNMEVVTLENGTKKVKCLHCKSLFAKSGIGTTTQYKRHLASCLQRQLNSEFQNKMTQHDEMDVSESSTYHEVELPQA